jgi:hypothetical protein
MPEFAFLPLYFARKSGFRLFLPPLRRNVSIQSHCFFNACPAPRTGRQFLPFFPEYSAAPKTFAFLYIIFITPNSIISK